MRLLAYHVAALVSGIALVLSIVSIERIDYVVTPAAGGTPRTELGLFRRCDVIETGGETRRRCRRYPKRRLDCPSPPASPLSAAARAHFSRLMGVRRSYDARTYDDDLPSHAAPLDDADDPRPVDHFGYCHLWITSGYAAGLSVASVAVATIAYVATTLPQIRTRQRKQHGWKLCAALSAVHAVLQAVSIGIIAALVRRSGRFDTGAYLGPAFVLACVSLVVSAVLVVGLGLAEYFGIARSRQLQRAGERRPLLADAR